MQKTVLRAGALGVALLLVLAAAAAALRLHVDNIVVVTDGGFSPTTLPKRGHAPIKLHGYGKISTDDGSVPAVLLHARTKTPAIQTYAIIAPIERQRGEYRYRVTIDVPPIAGGNRSLTHLDATIGRRYRAGGKRRSYISARCSDNLLRTRGSFLFAGGLSIEGSVEKFCRQQ